MTSYVTENSRPTVNPDDDRPPPAHLRRRRRGGCRLLVTAECVNEYSYMGRFIFEGLLFWCPTNFQRAGLNFSVDGYCNKLARLMGLCVTLYHYAAFSKIIAANNKHYPAFFTTSENKALDAVYIGEAENPYICQYTLISWTTICCSMRKLTRPMWSD
jgi:hypothetical protein